MTIKSQCTSCATQLTIKPELLGKQIKCPKCETTLVIGKPKVPAAVGQSSNLQSDPAKVQCQCGMVLAVPVSVRGKNVRCPKCQLVLKTAGPRESVAAAPQVAEDLSWDSIGPISSGLNEGASSFPTAGPSSPGSNPYAKPQSARKGRKGKTPKAASPQRDWAETVSRRIHMILFLMAIGGPFVTVIIWKKMQNEQFLQARGKTVVGVVIDAKEIRKRKQMTAYRLTVHFTTEEQQAQTDVFGVDFSFFDKHPINSNVDIVYDPAEPSNAMIAGAGSGMGPLFACIAASVIGLCGSAYILFVGDIEF